MFELSHSRQGVLEEQDKGSGLKRNQIADSSWGHKRYPMACREDPDSRVSTLLFSTCLHI